MKRRLYAPQGEAIPPARPEQWQKRRRKLAGQTPSARLSHRCQASSGNRHKIREDRARTERNYAIIIRGMRSIECYDAVLGPTID